MMKNSELLLLMLAMILSCAGCTDSGSIDRYRTEKSAPTEDPHASLEKPAEGLYAWQAPETWEQVPPSSMRMASYRVPAGSEQGDLSVVRIGGLAGGQINNLNRWRGQLGLPAIDEQAPEAAAQTVVAPAGRFLYWRLNNDEQPAKGMLVAMLEARDHVLFVKLNGSADLTAASEEDFLAYLKSFSLNEGREP